MDKRKVRKFNRICNELAELMEDMHEINPNIMLFVSGEASTSAMLIDTKDEDEVEYWRNNQEECVIASVDIPYADCGGI